MTRPEAEWIENLSQYGTLSDLGASEFFRVHEERIMSFLRTPQVFNHHGASPRLSAFLRIVQWNIEKGKRFDSLVGHFLNSDVLKWADVIILNEADYGMNRSRNRHVAQELAERLGMHMVFGPAHLELTKGTGEDLAEAGENRESLQGNAILSRYPVLDASNIPLPVTFEPYEFEEKRFGRRFCLWAQLKLRQSCLWVGSTHLELRNTPKCRAMQMKQIMRNLPGANGDSYILGGDLNTNGFKRGNSWRTVQSVSRILFLPSSRVKSQLLQPENGREPLFEIAKNEGFFWENLNSNDETARTEINSLEEARYLPAFLLKKIRKRLEPYGGYLCFKLDWIFGKRLDVLGCGQKCDETERIYSLAPGRIDGINYGPDRISDHLPIFADLDLR